MACDQDALLARSGDASKLLQSLADKRPVLQRSVFVVKRLLVHRNERTPVPFRSKWTRQRLPTEADPSKRADSRRRLESRGSSSSAKPTGAVLAKVGAAVSL